MTSGKDVRGRWTSAGALARERLRAIVALQEWVESEVRSMVVAAHGFGVHSDDLASILGVDRSTLYRRYLSPTPKLGGAVKGGRPDDVVNP